MSDKNKHHDRMNISLYDKDKQRLDVLAKQLEISRSAVIRLAVKKLYEEVTTKKKGV